MTKFNKGGQKIGKALANEMIDRHQNQTKSVYFDVEQVKALCSVPGAAGVSVYFAVDEKGKNTVVLLPVSQEGKVIWNDNSELTKSLSSEGNTALELGNTCPPYCPER